MSIWLCRILAIPTASMLSCFIPGQCRSDSASPSPLPQTVCYIVWSLNNVDLTLPHRALPQKVICYLVWSLNNFDLTLTAPSDRMLYCFIPWQCRSEPVSSSPLPQIMPVQCWCDSLPRTQTVCYLVWFLDNVLTLPRHRRSHREWV